MSIQVVTRTVVPSRGPRVSVPGCVLDISEARARIEAERHEGIPDVVPCMLRTQTSNGRNLATGLGTRPNGFTMKQDGCRRVVVAGASRPHRTPKFIEDVVLYQIGKRYCRFFLVLAPGQCMLVGTSRRRKVLIRKTSGVC